MRNNYKYFALFLFKTEFNTRELFIKGTYMLKFISFEDEIDIYWNRAKKLDENENYVVYLNQKKVGTTKKTHFELKNLSPDCQFEIAVELSGGKINKKIGCIFAKTRFLPNRIDITKQPYCALGDGKTLNTNAIQKALNDCKAGDCVYIPNGTYLTGGLKIHSNTYLYLEDNAVLKGTENFNDYLPKVKSRFEGIEQMCYQSLINIGDLDHKSGYNCKNVVIRGGSIIGGGEKLGKSIIEEETRLMKEYLEKNKSLVAECETSVTIQGRARGRLLQVANTKNLVLANTYYAEGASWNLHFIYSKDIVTTGCHIQSIKVHNGDGWDPDSSENCVLYNTKFETGDDCVAIKSGKNPEGNVINRPSKNIKIFDCYAISGTSIAMGSEMSGGVENVEIWDCNVANTIAGINIKAAEKRGGYIKNVKVYDTVACQVSITATVGYNNDGQPAKTPSKLSDFYFENLSITGIGLNVLKSGERKIIDRDAIILQGLDRKGCEIQNVTFVDCTLLPLAEEKIHNVCIKNTKNIVFKNFNANN